MTTFATGVYKTLTVLSESTFGVKASGTGQQLRRVSSDMNLNVASLESNEILPSLQVRDARHGPRQVTGTISGQFSPGTYGLLLSNLMRNSYVAGVSVTGIADSVLTVDGSGLFATLSSASSTFITAGFAVGDVVRLTGLTGASVADNGVDMRITTLTQTSMVLTQIRGTLVGYASGQTLGIAVPGKKLTMGTSQGASFSLEHWYADVGKSELFLGCKVSQISINVPASGFVQMQASITAQQRVDATSQALTGPTGVTTSNSLTANGGSVFYAGAANAYISQMSLQISADLQADPTIGSDIVPAIFQGTMRVRGSFSALMAADTMDADFLNETELGLGMVMTTGPLPTADFVNLYVPRTKLMSGTKNDSNKAIMRSFNFVGLEALTGADTSIVVQDSLQP